MLTFFRRIRKGLLGSGNARKYFIYAIGEIALVVIGILIALQINTKHELSTEKKKVERMLQEILPDLESDMKLINRFLSSNERRDSLANNVLQKKISAEDYRKNEYQNLIIFTFEPIPFNISAYDRLLNNVENIPEKYLQLMDLLENVYKREANSITYVYEELRTFMDHILLEYQASHDWYSDTEHDHLSQRVNYYLTSPKYKNDVKRYLEISRHIRLHFKRFIRRATIAYNEIHRSIKPDVDFSPDVMHINLLELQKLKEYEGLYNDGVENIRIQINEEGFLTLFNQSVFNQNKDTFSLDQKVMLIFERDSSGQISSMKEIYPDTTYLLVKIKE